MNINQLLTSMHDRSLEMLKRTLEDFSDADMLARPAVGGNHSAWQVGHLICSETRLVGMADGATAPLPEGFANRFTKDTARLDDAMAFVSKAELLKQFDLTHAATINWMRGLSPDDLDKPGPEAVRTRLPTIASIATLLPLHSTMHMGQIQAIRRVLGKPVLF